MHAIRAVSAYLVVFYHFALPWVPGGLGVLAFFVLSGFLITWLLLDEFEKSRAISFSGFYTRRALRIFPAFYVYAAVVLALLLIAGKHVVWGQTFASLFYVNNYYQALNGDPNTGFSHTWSLAIEEQFYLLWPMLFALLASRPRALGRWLIGIILLVWVHRWLLVWWGASSGYLYEAFDTRADHLAIGCLLAVCLRNGWATRLWATVCSRAALPALTLGALALSSMAATRIPGYRDVIGFVVDPLLVAILIAQLIAFAEHSMWAHANGAPLRFLGRISYSLYLYQQLVSGVVESALRGLPFAAQLLAYVAGVTAVAAGSYWIVERPFLALKSRLSHRAGREPATAEPTLSPAEA